jgi:hypothetical protein
MVTAACVLAVALGVLVVLWPALPALLDGQTSIGVLVAVCAGLAVVLGVGFLVTPQRGR